MPPDSALGDTNPRLHLSQPKLSPLAKSILTIPKFALFLALTFLPIRETGVLWAEPPSPTDERKSVPNRENQVPPYFEFLYIDSNTGQSSGGHSALRFGDWVYHFQLYPDQIFHLVREPWFDFRYTYNVLENRTIQIIRIGVTPEDRTRIENAFRRYYLIQEKHLTNLKQLHHDREWLQSLLDPRKSYGVEGVGYISHQTQSRITLGIRDKIQERYGDKFLLEMRNRVYSKIQDLTWTPQTLPADRFSTQKYPKGLRPFSSQLDDLLRLLAITETLTYGHGLDQRTIRNLPPTLDSHLTFEENKMISDLRDRLTNELIEDIGTIDPLDSYHFLVKLITCLVLEETLITDHFQFLDTLSEHSERIHWEDPMDLANVSVDIEPLFQKLRVQNQMRGYDLALFLGLQDSANRLIEVYSAKNGLRPIRHLHTKSMPRKRGLPLDYPKIHWSRDQLQKYLTTTKQIHQNYQKKMEEIYPYQLVMQNCSTEIFRTIDSAFDGNPSHVEKALGKHIDPSTSLSFIPSYAGFMIKENYTKTKTTEVLSFRRAKIAKFKKDESSLRVFFRETFTPTSTLYRFNSEDHWFLFFTDDTIALRPILGIPNLGVGLLETVVGIPSLPWDRGKRAKRGIQGMFFSLPELVFFNIRKGSFMKVRWSELDPDFPYEISEQEIIP